MRNYLWPCRDFDKDCAINAQLLAALSHFDKDLRNKCAITCGLVAILIKICAINAQLLAALSDFDKDLRHKCAILRPLSQNSGQL
jgi:hypothetical protein